MSMDLAACCRLAQDIAGVAVTLLAEPAQYTAFCIANQFSPIQTYLLPQQFGRSIESLSDGEILSLMDLFQIRYLFFRLNGIPMGIGPFCTEFFSLADCDTVLRQAGLTDISPQDLLAKRGMYPVRPESEMLHLARSLARAMDLGSALNSVRRVQLGDSRQKEAGNTIPRKLYAEMINERYQPEIEFMDCIRRGDVYAALCAWRSLHQQVAYTKKIGSTMETARVAAAINRTTIRMAAAEAGLPALVNDLLSSESATIIRNAKTIDAIDLEHERIIRVYCQAIRERRDHQYSNLVLSAIYEMEHHYTEHITVQSLAEELEVSVVKLTSLFRKETGQTLLAYLTGVRMRQAARHLAESNASVNSIAAAVGILDTNYFIKLFKHAYGQTPPAYRRNHQL